MTDAFVDAATPSEEPTWPAANGNRVVFLIDAASGFERRLLEDWVFRAKPVLHNSGPHAACCPEFRDLFEKTIMRVKEE